MPTLVKLITTISVFGSVACGLAVNAPTVAEEKGYAPCADPQTQVEINACAASDYERADAELNRIYLHLSRQLDSARAAKLRNVQRSWLKYRDEQCALESEAYAGGSMYPTIHHSCLAKLTEAQVAALKRLLHDR